MKPLCKRILGGLILIVVVVGVGGCGATASTEQVAQEPAATNPPTLSPTATPIPPTSTPPPTDTVAPTATPVPPTPTPEGAAPEIVNLEDRSISDGERFSRINLDEYVTDADHEAGEIEWQISGNQELDVRFVGGNLFVSLPTANWTGSETLTFEACDPDGLCASQEVTFTVRAENDAPVVSAGGQIVMPGETFAAIILDDLAYDEDHADDELTWSVSGNTVLGVTIEEGIAAITLSDPDWRGQETVHFQACDPEGACGSTEAIFQVMDRSDAQVEVTYVMNAGFLIAVGDKKILIDALIQEPALPREVAGPLELAQPPFDDVDLILATHSHFDHFSADKVASHLQHNPQAVFVAPTDAARMVNATAGMQDQIIPIRLQQKAGEKTQLVVNGIGLECIFLSHGGDILNLGYVITAEGRRFFHTGDMDPDSVSVSALKGYGLPAEQIDVAFVAHFMLITEEQHAHVTEGIQARYIVPMHFQFTAPPPDYDLMASYFPEAIVFHETMESWVLPGSIAPLAQEVGGAETPLVLVPAGPFVMGNENGAAHRPPHTVIPDEYVIDQYAVTNAQFATFLSEQGNLVQGGTSRKEANA